VIAIAYNLINFLFWLHISTMPNATSMVYIFVYPCFWIITLIIIGTLVFKNKTIWLSSAYRASTIIALFFCTPMPFLWAKAIAAPSSYCASTEFLTKDGHTIKSEEWVYNTGGLNVIKYWKANEPDCNDCDSASFKPDSVWVYLGKKKDTLRVDRYKNGKLIGEKKE
jgi:hypothetical protein